MTDGVREPPEPAPLDVDIDEAVQRGDLIGVLHTLTDAVNGARRAAVEEADARRLDTSATKQLIDDVAKTNRRSTNSLYVVVALAILGVLVNLVFAGQIYRQSNELERQADEIIAQRNGSRVRNCLQLNEIKATIIERSVAEREAMVQALANVGQANRTPEQEAQMRNVTIPTVLAQLEELTSASTATLAPEDCSLEAVNDRAVAGATSTTATNG